MITAKKIAGWTAFVAFCILGVLLVLVLIAILGGVLGAALDNHIDSRIIDLEGRVKRLELAIGSKEGRGNRAPAPHPSPLETEGSEK